MEVRAAGLNRNHGWKPIVHTNLADLEWGESDTVEWKGVELHLNGKYTVQVIMTAEDAKSLVRRFLTRDDMISMLGLTDEEKITIARETLRSLSFEAAIARLHGDSEQKSVQQDESE